MPEQYIAVVCPSEGEIQRKDRTPEAERKWRKRHGLPPLREQGQRGPGKAPRVDRQEVARAVARVIVDNPTAPATILAELAGLIGEEAGEKERKAAAERVRQALKDLEKMPSLAGDEALAETVRQALAKRKEEKERRRQEREKKQLHAEEEAALMAWLQYQQAVHAREMSARRVRVGNGDLLKWAGNAYALDISHIEYIYALDESSRPADIPEKIPAVISTIEAVSYGFKKGKGGGKRALVYNTSTE